MRDRFEEVLLENADLEKEMEVLRQKALVYDEDVKEKQERLASLEQQISHLNSQSGIIETERNSLKEDLQIARKATSYLNSQFSKAKQSLAEKLAELEQLKIELEDVTSIKTSLTDDVSLLEGELETAKAERDDLDEKLLFALENKKEVDDKFDRTTDIISSLKNNLTDISSLLSQDIDMVESTDTQEASKENIEVTLLPDGLPVRTEVAEAPEVKIEKTPQPAVQEVKSVVEKTKKEKAQEEKLARDKKKATSYYNRGQKYVEQGKYKQAARQFRKAIEWDPNDADSHYNLGINYDDHLKRDKLAAYHYKRYLELRPRAKDAGEVKKWLRRARRAIK